MDNTIYVGKYKVPKSGTIPLPKSKLRVLSCYVNTAGEVDSRVTLVIEDENFWPAICKMSDEEARDLAFVLIETVMFRGDKSQFTKTVGE
ncbi:hypothetical protein ES703_00064 [subsurface metagenome]